MMQGADCDINGARHARRATSWLAVCRARSSLCVAAHTEPTYCRNSPGRTGPRGWDNRGEGHPSTRHKWHGPMGRSMRRTDQIEMKRTDEIWRLRRRANQGPLQIECGTHIGPPGEPQRVAVIFPLATMRRVGHVDSKTASGLVLPRSPPSLVCGTRTPGASGGCPDYLERTGGFSTVLAHVHTAARISHKSSQITKTAAPGIK